MEKRKRVLVVDCDEQILISLEHLLEDQGIETTTTWSAQQALELLRGVYFDLLLMGDHLSDLSCEQLLREIQKEGGPASIFIMESASALVPSLRSHYECLGATGTLRKRDFGAVLRCVNSSKRRTRTCAA